MKNWKHIDEVTVIDFNRNKKKYPSLKAAVLDSREYVIKNLKHGRLGYASIWWTTSHNNSSRFYDGQRGHYNWKTSESYDYWCGGDPVIFVDELGMIIPPWKVQEVYNNLENVITNKWRVWGRRGRFSNYYRYPKTLQEIRENIYFEEDEYTKHYNIKFRRRRSYIPTAWDDRARKDIRDRSWKKHRKHQWKDKK